MSGVGTVLSFVCVCVISYGLCMYDKCLPPSSLFNLLRFQTNVFEGDDTATVIGEETVSVTSGCVGDFVIISKQSRIFSHLAMLCCVQEKLREHCSELQVSNKGSLRKLKDLE